MSDEEADAVAELISADAVTFASLPLPLAQRIFLELPPDARGVACCVCRAWRDVLAEPSLWTHLDMSDVPVKSLRERRRVHDVLRGAADRARGQLCQLKFLYDCLEVDELLPVLRDNADSLRELHLYRVHCDEYTTDRPEDTVKELMEAAPLLKVLAAEETNCFWKHVPHVLRAEPPFAPLQTRRLLYVLTSESNDPTNDMESFSPCASALADATLQPSLFQLTLGFLDTAQAAVMGALVDAALARRLRELKLFECTPPPAAPLARLLSEGSLTVLEISWTNAAIEPLFDAAGAVLVADALRMNTTLTSLNLGHAHLCRDMRVAGVLLSALLGHPSLRELDIYGEDITVTTTEARNAFGAALAALVAADTPSLHVLECHSNSLGDAGLVSIVEALVLNHHLRWLNVNHNGISEAFARERLLPALRAHDALWSRV